MAFSTILDPSILMPTMISIGLVIQTIDNQRVVMVFIWVPTLSHGRLRNNM